MDKYSLKLIDSTYSAEEAKEVLSTLINDKIKFLNLQIFSKGERFGADTKHLENRVEYLREERENLFVLLEEMANEGKSLRIQCDIRVEATSTADLA